MMIMMVVMVADDGDVGYDSNNSECDGGGVIMVIEIIYK